MLITPIGTTPMLTTPIGTMPIEMMPRGATPTATNRGLPLQLPLPLPLPLLPGVAALESGMAGGTGGRANSPAN
jgi:hypothetical protein